MKNFGELEKTLGVIFVNQKLLKEALTHRSFLNENNNEAKQTGYKARKFLIENTKIMNILMNICMT